MRRTLVAAYRARGIGYLCSTVLLVAAVIAMAFDQSGLAVTGVAVAVGLVGFAGSLLLIAFGPRLLRSHVARVVAAPVDGRWLAMNSPASKVPSHGVRMYGQSHAIDLVHEPDDQLRPEFGGGAPMMRASQQYPAFGAPVSAMIDGTVVRASSWRRDHRARSNWVGLAYLTVEGMIRELGGPGFILGNHVTIRGESGEFATVAHLQQGSVTVGVGDSVRAGQQVGRCGNSGNSSEPHVHAQLMDRVSPWTGQGIPFVFAGIALGDDTDVRDALPKNEQYLHSG